MPKRINDFKILRNNQINQDHFVLELLSPEPLPQILPGQFVQARVDGSKSTFLRRPLSVHDVDYGKNSIKLLIQVVGEGTKFLSRLAPGESLNLIYPLGNSFSMPLPGEKVLLVGGGCGIAPLLYLAKSLSSDGFKPDILTGFRNKSRIMEKDELAEYGNVHIVTEDGSEGVKGVVTTHPVLIQEKFNRIYCCGPEAMMRAIALHARQNNIFCEVSLENLMACGMGVCLCCIVKTSKGNLCSCTDGPVFNINDLLW